MPYFIQKLRQPIVLASFSFVQVLHANATRFGVYGNLAPGFKAVLQKIANLRNFKLESDENHD